MIEIARFADVYEAEIAASRLRADGFDPVLGGAEHVKTNPLVLQALGGVNLSVPNDQATAARLRLEQLRGGSETDRGRRSRQPETRSQGGRARAPRRQPPGVSRRLIEPATNSDVAAWFDGRPSRVGL